MSNKYLEKVAELTRRETIVLAGGEHDPVNQAAWRVPVYGLLGAMASNAHPGVTVASAGAGALIGALMARHQNKRIADIVEHEGRTEEVNRLLRKAITR